MTTIEKLKEVSIIMKKTINLKKSPRANKNYNIINLIIDGVSYSDIGDKLGVSRQSIGDMVKNSKRIFLKE